MRTCLDPALVRSLLQRIARGQIVSVDGVLRHHSDVLPPQALSLLDALHRQDYLCVRPGQPVAVLSVSGIQLLDWSNRQPHLPHSLALLTGDDTAGGTAEAVGEVAPRGVRM
ncbi:hypothetical protein L3Q67_01355 [Saccharothrix sp. AJ9571]|nr:hypothetical protein L3Q67_01355 [Saccharothrix sp. AJ9571]